MASVIESLAAFAHDPPIGDQWATFVQALTGQMLLYEQRIRDLVAQAMKAEVTSRADHRPKKTDVQELIGGNALKPQVFSNDSKGGIRKWANTFRLYMNTRKHEYQVILDWAEQRDEPIGREEILDMANERRIENVQEMNDTIASVLIYLTDDEAGVVVEHFKNNGLEAWRSLHERWLHRSKLGATAISDQMRSLPRPKHIGLKGYTPNGRV